MMADRDLIRTIVRQVVMEALSESNPGTGTEVPSSPSAYFAPWTGTEYESHPSHQQFDSAGTAANLVEFVENQPCIIETNRTCDHCGMCRRLGY